MNKRLTVILAGIFISVFSIVTISEAQTMRNEGLNSKQEKIVTIAAFTANGDLQKLKTALNEGLDARLTINEIKEVLVQMYAYAGFPRSLNGINTFIGVLEEREQKGIKDELGKEPSSMPANKSSIELGTEIQTSLIGAPATLIDSKTTQDFISLLPLTLTMNDLFRREKYAHLPRAISTDGKRTHTYEVGDVAYWPPGPDVAIFYRHDGQEIPNPGIIVIGKIDSGVEAFNVAGSLKVTVELIK